MVNNSIMQSEHDRGMNIEESEKVFKKNREIERDAEIMFRLKEL